MGWLSKGKSLERFCALLDEVKTFLSSGKRAAYHLVLIEDDEFMANVEFLADIFGHLNTLNLQLQGRGKTIVDIVEKLQSFTAKLELLDSDMSTGRLLHFNTLKTRAAGRVTGLMVEFIKQLRANFASRLEDFSVPRDVIAFVRDPLAIRSSGELSSLANGPLTRLRWNALIRQG